MALLEVRDLTVSYPARAGAVPAVRGVDLTLDLGDPRPGRRVRLRQVDHGRGYPAPAAAGDQDHRQRAAGGRGRAHHAAGPAAAVRWTEAAVVFQGAMHALNPVRRVGDQIAEAIHLHDKATDKQAAQRVGSCWSRSACPPAARPATPTSCRAASASG